MSQLGDDASLSSLQSRDWQSAYDAVLRETDVSALFGMVEIAEAALLTRRDVLANRRSNHHAEWEAVTEALRVLGILKRYRLKFDGGT